MELSVDDLIPFKYYKLNIQHEMDGEPEDVDDPENIAIYAPDANMEGKFIGRDDDDLYYFYITKGKPYVGRNIAFSPEQLLNIIELKKNKKT